MVPEILVVQVLVALLNLPQLMLEEREILLQLVPHKVNPEEMEPIVVVQVQEEVAVAVVQLLQVVMEVQVVLVLVALEQQLV